MKRKVLPLSLSLVETKTLFFVLSFLSLAVPFSLGDSQFITGSLVNAFLFCSGLFLPPKLFLPLVVFPSLGVLSRGLLFGPLTSFLVFFLPFIWLGNLALILVFKRAFSSFSYSLTVFLSALAKSLVLFASASLFFRLGIVPQLFLSVMGFNQFITACLGGLLASLALKKFHGKC